MITKPLTWAVHLEKENIVPIFSVDINPQGQSFVTAGEDGVVKIWNMQKAFADENLPQTNTDLSLLAEIKTHEKPVNSVRFNRTGRLLASGSSDGMVSIAIQIPHDQHQGRAETWKSFWKFHQQKLDISEVAWGTAEKSKLLASCSLDGSIVIWDIDRGQAHYTICGHHNLIKGLAWDPLGQYVAGQAETEGVFIYRTSDWKCVQQISQPFRDAVGSVDHLRLSWSPNGSYLAGVQAYTLPQPYVAILSRDRWTLECCVVGHRSGISIAKWNPRFFQSKEDAKDGRLSMCLALGSVDKSFSLWRQTEKHPLLHLDGLFDNPVSDIAWSADGYTCLISSRGGLVALLNFTEEELGTASEYKLPLTTSLSTTNAMPVAENLNLWMLEQRLGRKSVEKRSSLLHEEPQREPKKQRKELISSLAIDDQIQMVNPIKEKKQSTLVYACGHHQWSIGNPQAVRLMVDNSYSGKRCLVMCFVGEMEQWRDEIESKAVTIVGNLNFFVVGTDASTLRIYDEDGLQLISSLQLPSQASHLVVDQQWKLLCLTKCGEIRLWNIKERKIISRSSVCSLCKGAQLSSIKLAANGLPTVVLSDGHAFFYHHDMDAWISLTPTSVSRSGRYSAGLDNEGETLRRLSIDSTSLASRHVTSCQAKQELEHGIMTALDMQSTGDYQKWLLSYVRYLIARISNKQAGHEEEVKLRKICMKLISGREEIKGFDHQEFLKEKIMPELRKERDLQKLMEEIQEWFEMT